MADKSNELLKENIALAEQIKTTYAGVEAVISKNAVAWSELLKVQTELNKQLKNTSSAKEQSDAQKKLTDNIKATALAEKEQIKIEVESEKLKRQKIVTAQKEAQEIAKVKRATDQLSSAYKQESARLTELRNRAKDTALQFGLTSKEFKKAATEVNKLDANLKKVDSALGQNQRSVGNYKDAIKGVGTQLLSAAGIAGGIQLFVSGVKALGNEMLKNIKIQRLVRQAFKITGDELNNVSQDVQVISNVFDQEYTEVVKSANAISKEFGITASEALGLIKEGFEKGADNTGEFLNILKEYPTQLRSVGLSAEESIAIITQNVNEGIFSDKGVDAIKEAGIRLRELTPATRSALDAIGISSKEIEKSLSNGTKTLFQVIQEVSSKLSTLPAQSSRVGTAIADIFGGAGEDAGLRYLTTLKDINLELSSIDSNVSESLTNQRDLEEAWTTFATSITKGETALSQFVNTGMEKLTQLLNFASGKDSGFNEGLFTKAMAKTSEENLLRFKNTFEKDVNNINSKFTDTQLVMAASTDNIWRSIARSITENSDDASSFENTKKAANDLIELNQKLKIINNLLNKSNDENVISKDKLNEVNDESVEVEKDLIKIQEELLKLAKEMPGTTEAEISARNKSIIKINEEITRLKELGKLKDVPKQIEKPQLSFEKEDKLFDIEAETDREIQIYVDAEVEKYEKLKKIAEEEEEKLAEIRKAWLDVGFEAAEGVANALFDNAKTRRDEELAAELIAFDERLNNEKLDDEQRAAIEKEKTKREKELRLQNAKAEKRDALFKIAINTAIGVAQAIAAAPPPINWPLIAVQIAAGAVQAGIVAARPLPQFDKGTNYFPGYGEVAEKRPELVKNNGKLELFTSPTILGDDYRGAQVISGQETGQILNDITRREVINASVDNSSDVQLAAAVEKAFEKHSGKMIGELRKNRPIKSNTSGLENQKRMQSYMKGFSA